MPAQTFESLLVQLFSAADPAYLRPFFQGDYGNGREAFEALVATLVRVDQAITRTTQAMYLLPWSGQDAPPATGGFPARLTLRFRRTARAEVPLVVVAGAVSSVIAPGVTASGVVWTPVTSGVTGAGGSSDPPSGAKTSSASPASTSAAMMPQIAAG